MTKYKIKSIKYPELEVILCDLCYNEDVILKYDHKILSVPSIGDCVICKGDTEPDKAN